MLRFGTRLRAHDAGWRKIRSEARLTNIANTKRTTVITNRRRARRAAGRLPTCVANAVHEPRRDIKLDDSSPYKTSATVNETSSQRSHSSLDAGTEILRSERHTHSPRHPPRGKMRLLHVYELARDSGRIDRGGAIYRVHWRGSGDWPHIDASAPQRPHSLSCSNGSAHVQAGKPGRNLSIDKSDDQDGAKRLDPIGMRGKAEMMGPKGADTP